MGTSPPLTGRCAPTCSRAKGAPRCARPRRSKALETLGCRVDLLPTVHPVVDVVFFHLLTLAVAEAREIDPDPIRRTPGSPWAEAGGEAYPY